MTTIRHFLVVFLLLPGLVAFGQLPVLKVSNNGTNVVLSWTNSSNGPLVSPIVFEYLQTTPSLSPPIQWTNIPIYTAGSTNLNAINPEQYYRLLISIPIFDFAIFYNMNLEIAAAQPFDIQGPVYSNAGLWSGSDTIIFSNTVSAVGLVTNSVNDPFCLGYTSSGLSTYKLAGQPFSGTVPLTFPTTNTYANPAIAETFLNLPPTNYALGTASAFSLSGQFYIANEADLFLTNYPSGTNFNSNFPLGAPMALYYSSMYQPGYMTWVTNDFYIVSNYYQGATHIWTTNYVSFPTNMYASGFNVPNGFFFTNRVTPIKWTNNPPGTNTVWYMGYSFLTNASFVDWREGYHGDSGPPKKVQAVQFNVNAFNVWLTNSGANSAFNRNPNGGSNYNAWCNSSFAKNHPIDSIYIYNAVPLTSTLLPAARVVNGGMMPPDDGFFGFTITTAMPVYIWGDYDASNSFGSSLGQNDTLYTEPAAIMCDAITILSDGWADSVTAKAPAASTTTVNAACVAGIVPSDPINTASDALGYSGGVENYFRLLENWGSATFWFNGSMVAMFPSQYATKFREQTGGYYDAPVRKWAYDTNLSSLYRLPPLTPTVANYVNP